MMMNDKSCLNDGYITPVAEHPSLDEVYEATPFSEAFWTYLNYIILNIFGWFRDFLRNTRIENRKGSAENNPSVNTIKKKRNNLFNCFINFSLGFCSIISKL
jgi:hypothetical protein